MSRARCLVSYWYSIGIVVVSSGGVEVSPGSVEVSPGSVEVSSGGVEVSSGGVEVGGVFPIYFLEIDLELSPKTF